MFKLSRCLPNDSFTFNTYHTILWHHWGYFAGSFKKKEIKKKRLSTSTGGVKVLEEFCTELKSYIVVLVIKHLLHVAVNCCPLVGETKGDAKGLQGKNFPALSLQPGQQFPRSSALPQKPCDKWKLWLPYIFISDWYFDTRNFSFQPPSPDQLKNTIKVILLLRSLFLKNVTETIIEAVFYHEQNSHASFSCIFFPTLFLC